MWDLLQAYRTSLLVCTQLLCRPSRRQLVPSRSLLTLARLPSIFLLRLHNLGQRTEVLKELLHILKASMGCLRTDLQDTRHKADPQERQICQRPSSMLCTLVEAGLGAQKCSPTLRSRQIQESILQFRWMCIKDLGKPTRNVIVTRGHLQGFEQGRRSETRT